MKQTAKRIWNLSTSVLVASIVILAILLVGVRLTGLQVYSVLSGSMEPAYPVGSLIYVKDVDTARLGVGDVITFRLDENTVATHRITEVVSGETDTPRFRTKGDANEVEDGALVREQDVIGTPVFTIPWLGYAASFLQHPPGRYLAISAGGVLLLMVLLPDLLASDDTGKNTANTQNHREAEALSPEKQEDTL